MSAQKRGHMSHDQKRDDDNTTRIALLEQSIGHIGQSLLRIEKTLTDGFNRVDDEIKRLDAKIDNRFDSLSGRMDSLNGRLWQLFFWMIGGFAGILALLAHAVHWI